MTQHVISNKHYHISFNLSGDTDTGTITATLSHSDSHEHSYKHYEYNDFGLACRMFKHLETYYFNKYGVK